MVQKLPRMADDLTESLFDPAKQGNSQEKVNEEFGYAFVN